jgi:hypothetical protein
MSQAVAIALVRMLLEHAPEVVMWVLKQAGIIADAPALEKMKRVTDIMHENPMDRVSKLAGARIRG